MIAFSFWWVVQMLRRYHKPKQRGSKFRSSPTFKSDCLCGVLKNYEVEGLLKALACASGITGEIITGFHDGKFAYYGNMQHSIMFTSFMIAGILDILRHHKLPIPEEASYSAILLSFLIEGILFKYHLHHRNEIDVLIHTLLVYTIFCNILACLAEMAYRESLLAAVSRAYFTMLQGVWFIAVGFMLYNPFKEPNWDPENHDHFMLATMLFACHILGCAVVILILNCIIAVTTKKENEADHTYHMVINKEQENKLLLEDNGNVIYMQDDL